MQKPTELFYEQLDDQKEKQLYFNGRHIEIDAPEFQNICAKLATVQRQKLPIYNQDDLTISSYKKHLVITGKFTKTEPREAFLFIIYETTDVTYAYKEVCKRANECGKTIPAVDFNLVEKSIYKMKKNLRFKALFAALIIILLALYFILPKLNNCYPA